MKFKKPAGLLLAALLTANTSFAAHAEENLYEPQLSYGAYVDTYNSESEGTLSPETNPAVRIVKDFFNYWEPGEDGYSGKRLRPDILDYDLHLLEKYTSERTPEQEASDYFDERRNYGYSLITGFGPYLPSYVEGSGIYTIQTELPEKGADKLPKRLTENPLGNPDSELGACVRFAEYLQETDLPSLQVVKKAFRYLRPFRRSDTVKLNPYVAGAVKKKSEKDYGYTSGHTMRSYLIGLGYAYMFPQRYQEFLTRASEIGFSRNRMGRHNCLDVVGGRMIGTANAAAFFNAPENADMKRAAYEAAQSYLVPDPDAPDDFSDKEKNRALYTERLTYNFPTVGDTTKPMVVPKGAEVLLETRFPYLTKNQIRTVLYTTGISSGYPVCDDEEGWGRLNLFAAADGYGAFLSETVVTMNMQDGGFSARDTWGNDITGEGSLVKRGTGTLVLAGKNTYKGGTRIESGVLEAADRTAFGSGRVDVNGGIMAECVNGPFDILNSLEVSKDSVMVFTIGGPQDVINVSGRARIDGKLRIVLSNEWQPKSREILHAQQGIKGDFSRVQIEGLPAGFKAEVQKKGKGLWLMVKKENEENPNA